jgi:hypothetical protein
VDVAAMTFFGLQARGWEDGSEGVRWRGRSRVLVRGESEGEGGLEGRQGEGEQRQGGERMRE